MANVEHTPLTNGIVKVTGILVEGGTLNVSNVGIAVLANGDSFKLFNAGTYSGAFSGFVLPSLNAGLVWNTNLLSISGTLAVANYSAPAIGKPVINNGSLNITGSGGVAYWNYYVLASTNLTAPWTIIATNQFDANGNFTFTNLMDPTAAQVFYRVQMQ
jgi:hypothetical protein